MSKPHVKTSGAAIALVLGIVAAVWLATSTGPATASVEQTAAALAAGTGSDDNPTGHKALVDDLKDARCTAKDEIREKAKNGDYGKLAQRNHRDGGPPGPRPGLLAEDSPLVALLPDALQSDLADVRKADSDDRKAMMDDIRKKALDGDYGDKVKKAWTLMDEHRAKAEERRCDPKGKDDNGKKDEGEKEPPSDADPSLFSAA